MKKECKRHDHTATKILKITLFIIVMILPILYLLVEVSPYAFNQNYTTNESIMTLAANKVLNNNLLNWTSNTLLYTGINAMFTQLNINSTLLIEVLTYWLMLTSIYVIIDIVLEMFVFLTHWINDRNI